jgi:DNA replication protein DnaC
MTTDPGKTSKSMDEDLIAMLKYLRLGRLLSHWDETLTTARQGRYSPERLLKYVLEEEYQTKRENARLLRRQRANIPEMLEMETFPFSRQPKLDRKKIMSYYDGFDYMLKRRNMVWLGPTGCGKSGLATAFLLQAIDRGHRGYFVTFPQLLHELFQSLADHSDQKILKPAQVGQFFTLMHKRHKKKTTLITSNLGFAEWGSFLHNKHLTAALIDRLTENSHVINMKNCTSLRDKLDE